MTTRWVIMPVADRTLAAYQEVTHVAISDVLALDGDPSLLIVNQGCPTAIREALEHWADGEPRLWLWHHDPPLPSVAMTWNRALAFVWATGAPHAFVVNNDVRLHPPTFIELERLLVARDLWFVSAVGRSETEWTPWEVPVTYPQALGGPDFSAFLISQTCHQQATFDEHFIPAYCEDCDYHRRLLLAGHGAKIGSVPIPYWHRGSHTLNTRSPEDQATLERQIAAGSRAYYRRKWGGDPHAERYRVPFDPSTAADGMTNPDLQRGTNATP